MGKIPPLPPSLSRLRDRSSRAEPAGSPGRAPLPPCTRRARPEDASALPGPAAPGSDPGPRPSLRDVLVEVGEEQLAGASLATLTRQVHGGRAAGGPGPGLARGRAGRGELRVGAGPRSPPLAARISTAASSRPRSCLCSRAGLPGAPARPRLLGARPPMAQAYCGGPPLHLRPGPGFRSNTRTRGDARGRNGLALRAGQGPRKRVVKSRRSVPPAPIFLLILKEPVACQSLCQIRAFSFGACSNAL